MPTEPTPVALHYSAAFLHQLKRLRKKYRRIQSDLQPLLDELRSGATPGDRVQGTGHAVHKVRLPNSDAQRGTSGGYRVIYYVQTASGRLLVTIYSEFVKKCTSCAFLLSRVRYTPGLAPVHQALECLMYGRPSLAGLRA